MTTLAWVLLLAGIITLDAANDAYRLEVVAGLLFLGAWLILTKEGS